MWYDVHTHLHMLDSNVEESCEAALNSGVTHMINVATNPEDLEIVVSTAEQKFPQVAAAVGIHPHDAKTFTPDLEVTIRRLAESSNAVVAIGEIGLDYHYEHTDRKTQIEVFRAQMRIASDLGLPVELHTRDAEEDTLTVLREFEGKVRGIFHCFTGTAHLANEGLTLGYNISFSGILTFKTAEPLREVAKSIPLHRIHIETDAPFLAPIPMRGKKNVPAYLPHTGKFLANLRGISEEELGEQLRKNAQCMFPKWFTC